MSEFTYYDETVTLLPPPGKATGLLEPVGGMHGAWGQAPLLRMAPGFRVVPPAEWSKWIDLQEEAKTGMSGAATAEAGFPYDQDGVGSCAAESGYGVLAICRELAGLPRKRFNPWGGYYTSSGGVDRGSTLQENLRLLRDVGAHLEELHPRSKGWRSRPSDESYAEAIKYRIDEFYEVTNWNELASALLQGWIVYWGYSGHAIVGCDLLNDRQFRYLNSWGNWGSPSPHNEQLRYGFGTANRSSVLWGYGVYAVRTPVFEVLAA